MGSWTSRQCTATSGTRGPQPAVRPELDEGDWLTRLVLRDRPCSGSAPELDARGDVAAVAQTPDGLAPQHDLVDLQRLARRNQALVELAGPRFFVELLEGQRLGDPERAALQPSHLRGVRSSTCRLPGSTRRLQVLGRVQ